MPEHIGKFEIVNGTDGIRSLFGVLVGGAVSVPLGSSVEQPLIAFKNNAVNTAHDLASAWQLRTYSHGNSEQSQIRTSTVNQAEAKPLPPDHHVSEALSTFGIPAIGALLLGALSVRTRRRTYERKVDREVGKLHNALDSWVQSQAEDG